MPRTIIQFVQVVVLNNANGSSSVIDIDVGSSLNGLIPVSIIGGNYNPSDPWVLELQGLIAQSRIF